jgi:hypothetical protein
MYRTLFAVAALALALLAAPGDVQAQGTGTVFTTPANSYSYTPSYATMTPSYATIAPSYGTAATYATTVAPTYAYTYTPSYAITPAPSYAMTPTYRPYVPYNRIDYTADGRYYATSGYGFIQPQAAYYPANNDVYTLSNGYPYYNPTTGTYYHAPTFNPGAVYGGFSAGYPSSYAPYRTFWNNISRYNVWTPTYAPLGTGR